MDPNSSRSARSHEIFYMLKGAGYALACLTSSAQTPNTQTNFARLASVCALLRCSPRSDGLSFNGFFRSQLVAPSFSVQFKAVRSSSIFTRLLWAFHTVRKIYRLLPSPDEMPWIEFVDLLLPEISRHLEEAWQTGGAGQDVNPRAEYQPLFSVCILLSFPP